MGENCRKYRGFCGKYKKEIPIKYWFTVPLIDWDIWLPVNWKKWAALPWVNLYVPVDFRAHYPRIRDLEWIEPASAYYTINSPFKSKVIDGPYLMTTRGQSSTMHWATAVRYSLIPRDIFRELFLGYEMQHMEGWDVFGDDAINDLIAEEAGRLLGLMLVHGRLTRPDQVVYALDEAFEAATAWVGAMMKVRIDELDELVRQKEAPKSNEWWEKPRRYAPWRSKGNVISLLRSEKAPYKLKEEDKHIQSLIRTYRVIYDSEEWEETHEKVVLSPITLNILKDYYDHQFKSCTKQWGLPWEFDPNDIRKYSP